MSITIERPRMMERPPVVEDTPTVETPAITHTLTVLGGRNERLTWVEGVQETLARAEQRFRHFRNQGYLAYTVDAGESVVTHNFVPNADIHMIPQMVGG